MTSKEITDAAMELTSVVRGLWPDSTLSVQFSPLVDLQYGDIGTDFLIKLSAERKEPPEQLGEELLGALNKSAHRDQFSYSHGYMNFRGGESSLFEEEEGLIAPLKSAFIILPGRRKNISLSGHVRMLCAAFLHMDLLFKTGADVILLDPHGQRPIVAQALPGLFRAACEDAVLGEASLEPKDIAASLDKSAAERAFIWLVPGTYSRKEFQPIVHHPSRSEGKTSLQTPDATWCGGIDPEISPEYLKRIIADEGLMDRARFYFSSPEPGLVIDPDVVLLNESANTWWFAGFLRERIGSIPTPNHLAPAVRSCTPLERDILIRCKYMALHQVAAARTGVVTGYITVIEDLLRKANRLYNDPKLRAQLRSSETAGFEHQILSGVSRVLTII